jgi:hypothetical protein
MKKKKKKVEKHTKNPKGFYILLILEYEKFGPRQSLAIEKSRGFDAAQIS